MSAAGEARHAATCEWCERDCPRCGYPIDAGWRHVDVPRAPGAGIVVCRAERVIGPLVEVLSGYLTHRRDLLRAIEERNPPVINEPVDLDEARQALADNGIDGPDLPYNPRALHAMRIADALLAEVEATRAAEQSPIAEAFARIAAAIDAVCPVEPPFITIGIVPVTPERVDAIAQDLFGRSGEDRRVGDMWMHIARDSIGRIARFSVSVQCRIADPVERKTQAAREELARLQAQIDEARRVRDGLTGSAESGESA